MQPGPTAMITLYGIKTCDTIRKARAWLAERGVAVRFHDYKVDGIEAARLEAWADAVGWEVLLNRAGTTFRALPEAQKADIDRAKALALMVAQPSMIKRPVLAFGPDVGARIVVGFKADQYEALFPPA